MCIKCGLVTSSKPPLYCTQTVCNCYSSYISLLQIGYAENEICLIKFTLENNSLNLVRSIFIFKEIKRGLGLITRSFLSYKIYLDIFLFKLPFNCPRVSLDLSNFQRYLYYYILLLLYCIITIFPSIIFIILHL